MATSSIDLLSVIPGLQVSASEILQAELLLSQVLTASDPTLDIRTGTAIRDLAIRPNATLLAVINKALVYYWSQNSLSNVDNNTPTIFVDKILQNFFMTRFQGSKATINVNLYFAKRVDVSIQTSTFFSTNGTTKFFPVVDTTFSKDQLIFDSYLNKFYISVDLEAESVGEEYNIVTGSLLYFSNFNSYFLNAEINYLVSSSQVAETNLQFVGRTRESLSTRNLVNSPSIKSNLKEAFPTLTEIFTVGMGDVEMIRDLTRVIPQEVGYPIWVHLGGCTDIYIKTPVVSSLSQFTTDSLGKLILTGPVCKVVLSSTAGGPGTDTILPGNVMRSSNSFLVSLIPTSLTPGLDNTLVVVCRDHGLKVGERFSVSGADQSLYNVTSKVDSVIDRNSFTYSSVGVITTPATGDVILKVIDRQKEVGFSSRQELLLDFSETKKVIPIGGITVGTNVLHVTCLNHGYHTGDLITLSGIEVPSYNGVKTITVTSPDSFDASTTTSTMTVTSVNMGAQKVNGSQSVSMVVSYFQDIDNIQAYLSDSNNRVAGSDPLARGLNITYLDISVTGYGAVPPNQEVLTKAINSYLNSLSSGQSFIMSDLISFISNAGITSIKSPLGITYTKYWRDLFEPTYGIIADTMNPNDSTNVFLLNSVVTLLETV
jgi:hypothetical protein